jgi:anti-sigma B factor antagonist
MTARQERITALIDTLPDLSPTAAERLVEWEDDHDARAQREAFQRLIKRYAEAGAGQLTPLCGGMRYISADGSVVIMIGPPLALPAQGPPLRIETIAAIDVVGFRDSQLVHPEVVREIGDQLYRLVSDGGHRQLLLNFGSVEFMSTALMGKLVGLNRLVAQSEGRMKICGLNPVVREAFRITQLDRVFEIHESLQGALARFDAAPASETTQPEG